MIIFTEYLDIYDDVHDAHDGNMEHCRMQCYLNQTCTTQAEP